MGRDNKDSSGNTKERNLFKGGESYNTSNRTLSTEKDKARNLSQVSKANKNYGSDKKTSSKGSTIGKVVGTLAGTMIGAPVAGYKIGNYIGSKFNKTTTDVDTETTTAKATDSVAKAKNSNITENTYRGSSEDRDRENSSTSTDTSDEEYYGSTVIDDGEKTITVDGKKVDYSNRKKTLNNFSSTKGTGVIY